MDAAWREPLLGIIEQRCVTGRNGAVWQSEMFHHISETSNADKRRRIRALKNDPRAIEDIARAELGMTYPGELVIRIEARR